MRTKDELFREALRHIAARRQQAVTAAERDRAAALAAHPELRAAEDARTHAGRDPRRWLPPAARTRPPQPQH